MSNYKKNGFDCLRNCGNKVSRKSLMCKPCSFKNRILKYGHPKLGKKNSIETRLKISTWRKINQFGNRNPNKGKKVLETHKKDCECSVCKVSRRELIGNKNPMYIDGRKTFRESLRALPEYFEWRIKVFERDNYTCQECGIKNESGLGKSVFLEAHHKRPLTKIIGDFLKKYINQDISKNQLIQLALKYKPFWNIKNGQTLCQKCHQHTKHGRNTWNLL